MQHSFITKANQNAQVKYSTINKMLKPFMAVTTPDVITSVFNLQDYMLLLQVFTDNLGLNTTH